MGAPLIENVSDTAFMVAAFRARETKRPDALFRDPLAERLAGERGLKIEAQASQAFMAGWTAIIRTVIIDDYIKAAVERGVDTVLNLGAGLDARPYRMDLPATLRWIEVDLPPVIELKERLLASERPRCQLERIKLDLSDVAARRQHFADIAGRGGKVLVLTEGLIPYLDTEAVASLAADLKRHEVFGQWIADYFSPETIRYRQRSGIQKQMENAPFKFAPGDWFAFFASHGWKAKETRYIAEEADRLKRPMPMRLPMKLLSLLAGARAKSAFQKFAGYVLLERA